MNPSRHNRNSARFQCGMSLIELVVGLSIGVFLLSGLVIYLSQSRFTFAHQQTQSSQHSVERLSTMILAASVQQAGFSPMTDIRIMSRVLEFPAEAPFRAGQGVVGTASSADVVVAGQAAPVTVPADTIAVRYWGDDGTVDCIGEPVLPGDLQVDVISTNGVHLLCSRDGAVALPILGDAQAPVLAQQLRILGMSVTYGLDTNLDEAVDTYQRSDAILNWTQVRVAKIDLIYQPGERPPKTLNTAVTFENMRGALQ